MSSIEAHSVWREDSSRQACDDLVVITRTYRKLTVTGVKVECYSTGHERARADGTYVLVSKDLTFLRQLRGWRASSSGDEFTDENDQPLEEPEDLEVFKADLKP